MIKTLIVDDDFLVRMFLRQVTDWEKAGFQLIGDARDGEEALQIAEQELPQLIITDISMPVMDGIALIRELKKRGNTAKIVVLSCHDDFEYVKEAMKLGADEYILKNLLTEMSLKELLLGLKNDIMKTENSDNLLKKVISVGSMALKKAYFKNIISGTPQNRQDALQAGLHEGFKTQAAFILKIDNFKERVESLPLKEQSKFQESFLQMCSQSSPDICLFEYIPLDDGRYAVFADLSELSGIYEKQQRLIAAASSLSVFAERYMDVKLKIGISAVSESGDGALCFNQAEEALLSAFYEASNLLYFWQLPKLAHSVPQHVALLSDAVQAKLASHEKEEMLRAYDACLDEIFKIRLSPKLIDDWIMRVDKSLKIEVERPKEFAALKLRGEIYEKAWDSLISEEEKLGIGTVDKVKEYIRKNYAEPISLTDLAEYVHLNPAYLSFLFKQETGVNFVDALLNCRMEKAKALLISSDEKVKDIAVQVGFQDYRYFCKTFKKIAGQRPQDFRKNAKS